LNRRTLVLDNGRLVRGGLTPACLSGQGAGDRTGFQQAGEGTQARPDGQGWRQPGRKRSKAHHWGLLDGYFSHHRKVAIDGAGRLWRQAPVAILMTLDRD
jgi:hypothetical protein